MNSTCELGADAARALKPYPAYKDSGVEWLGDVPAHWEVLRLKQICRLAYGDALADAVRRDGAVPVLGSNGRVGFHDSANTKAPCIVIGRKGSFGKVNYSPDPAFAIDTTFFVDSRFSSANIRWLFFLLRWLRLDEVTRDSAVPGLDREDTYQRPGVLPPLSEQAAIVRFLDHADRRIRRYVRAKQKLIALLEEQKQAIIHQAITGQIDVRTGRPFPAYKPSGVPWLGDVPKHWKTERAKWLFRKMEHPVRDNDEVVTCFRDGVVTLRKNRRVRGFTESLKEIGYQGVRRGDLVIHAMDAFAGAIGVSDSDGKGTPVYSVCSPRQSANAYYYAFCVREMARSEWILALAKGIRERSTDFRFKDFASQWVPLPPLSEQAAIVSFLDRATADLDAATTSAQRETSLIREYHARLIADVVTGKFDVREAAARLPDEVEELEPLDEADALIDGEDEPTDALATIP